MKKILYFIIPLVLIFIGTRFYKSGGRATAGQSATQICSVSASEYKKSEHKDVTIIDVRTEREYASGHLKNATVIDIYDKEFKEKISKLDKEKTYYVYCKSGIRSRNAANYMMNSGFKKVCELEGGLNSLIEAGVKLEQ